MIEANEVLLERYLQLPNRLEAAIAGLSESDLDLRVDEGWTIRQCVHHVVEGEYIWQLNLRAIVGTDGIVFPSAWYFALPQEEWVKRWAYDKRPLEPSLALYRAGTWDLVELLRNVPDAWDHFGRITFPGKQEETCGTVREIVEMNIRHVGQHVEEIQAIRALYRC
jgi:hypothetical protein